MAFFPGHSGREKENTASTYGRDGGHMGYISALLIMRTYIEAFNCYLVHPGTRSCFFFSFLAERMEDFGKCGVEMWIHTEIDQRRKVWSHLHTCLHFDIYL